MQKDHRKKKKKVLSGFELKDLLIEACAGLMYVSETDAPIETIFFAPEAGNLVQSLSREFGLSDQIPKQEDPISFFAKLTAVKPWHNEKDRVFQKRFSKIQGILIDNLTDLTCLRYGNIRIEIYIVGFDQAGNVAGLKTMSVET